jgi:hypothetical protein
MKANPAENTANVPARGRRREYSRGYAKETTALVTLLRANPLMTNAELVDATGFSESCVRINSGKARTIVKNDFKKSA